MTATVRALGCNEESTLGYRDFSCASVSFSLNTSRLSAHARSVLLHEVSGSVLGWCGKVGDNYRNCSSILKNVICLIFAFPSFREFVNKPYPWGEMDHSWLAYKKFGDLEALALSHSKGIRDHILKMMNQVKDKMDPENPQNFMEYFLATRWGFTLFVKPVYHLLLILTEVLYHFVC